MLNLKGTVEYKETILVNNSKIIDDYLRTSLFKEM
jgi:hypothetical protein